LIKLKGKQRKAKESKGKQRKAKESKGKQMPRPRQRVRLEDGLKLDLIMNKLIRDGFAKWGELRRGLIHWRRIRSGEIVSLGIIEANLLSEPFGWLTLEIGSLVQRIQLCAEWRHFGGVQWYFMCPASGRKASVLWLVPGAKRFLSRQAWGRQVAYGSQFETPHDRALSAAQDIRYRLGGKDYISLLHGLDPPKPKGMHWRTYEAKIKRCQAYEGAFVQAEAGTVDPETSWGRPVFEGRLWEPWKWAKKIS
jgi:hypothetical protein